MSKAVRRNLRIKIGDFVSIKVASDVPNVSKFKVAPFADTIEGVTGDITKSHLIPYFKDSYRPVKKGDCFLVRGNMKALEFKVVEIEPKDFGIVTDNTML